MKSGDILFESGDVQVIAVDSSPLKIECPEMGLAWTIGGGLADAFEIVAGGKSLGTYHADLASVIADATHCAAYRASLAAK